MDKETIETYNTAAEAYAQKFAGVGVRVQDIERVFSLVGKDTPKIVELGCGDGRDAKEICARTPHYVGIDASSEMIAIARRTVPEGKFLVADIETYEFEKGIDIVFAFASLLHLDKEVVTRVFNRTYDALNEGGIFHVSVKYGSYQGGITITDDYGSRVFYFYTYEDLEEMYGNFLVVHKQIQTINGTDWLDIVLQK